MDSDDDLVYFIPDLFKPSADTLQERIKEDDPFIDARYLKKNNSIFNSRHRKKKSGPSIIDVLGTKIFEEANKIQNAREAELLAQDRINEKLKEEKLKEEREVKKQLDEKVAEIFKKTKSCVKRSCPVKIPYKSNLNHDEHAFYLMAFLKYQTRAPRNSVEQQEYQQYLALQNRVFEEQQALMEFSKNASKLQLNEYNSLSPVIKEYLSRYAQHGYKRVLHYPRRYHLEQEIPLVPLDTNNIYQDLKLEHKGHLLSLGTVPFLKLPYPNRIVALPKDKRFLDYHPPEETHKARGKFARLEGANFLSKTTVSQDPNCEYLAKQHRANIVITPSVLKTLLDNPGPNFDKEWDIPVVVRSYSVQEADGSFIQHRVAYIDKPIKKKLWTPLDEKTLFFKKSSLSHMTQFRQQPHFRMKSPTLFNYCSLFASDQSDSCDPQTSQSSPDKRRQEPPSPYEDNPFDMSDVQEEVDVFGTNNIPNQPSQSKRFTRSSSRDKPAKSRRLSKNEDKDEDKSEEFSSLCKESKSMLDDLLDNQSKLLMSKAPETRAGMGKGRRIGEQTTIDDIGRQATRSPWSKRISTDWSKHDKAVVPTPGTGINYHYQLYQFHSPSTHSAPSGKGLPLINVLVRHHVHGLSLENVNVKGKTHKSAAYVISPKVENQVFFGCEVNTRAEIVRQYAELLVRPNTYVLHLRVCTQSGQVVLGEERDLLEVLREGHQPHIKFQPHMSLMSLYCTLNSVQRLPNGHYLLHHPNKSEAFIRLMKSIDEDSNEGLQTVFDLHSSYGFSDSGDSVANVMMRKPYASTPWLPIDTQVPTPFHLRHKKIPATFPMANPNKKLSKKERRQIVERAKKKKSIYDEPEDARKAKLQSSSANTDDIY